ncbi:MAG: hypothetical protein UX02_C0001G0115 [Candidatus Moranbacteria bacterium GW2011_GWC1_45_18]|nr:MAG: hypothetical protein UT79_C0002G0282 [Candidatus Moranbacteria bacterium GW2011_GWC2_40_12]KKT34121.1 MAG: hypothetical protein UW19_C0001G0016 [Candidatus Moranbacteria bacterium GW2011_GWF2_44_10]KKU00667.1 MAG: hypothetical protein UX02_C0001G0115 [Candidatus Moranbacteria bacterium GW2011_GWC1_45_18]OGI24533.1 MAG: hypothetical protein A2194_00225 [Candidatus Moranbacteria bacterium RIFOXYA1_FULL_44_8]OGI35143.1 MAG: hypothetical protein A2407_04425 [Candidatus Moranbacteria bacteri
MRLEMRGNNVLFCVQSLKNSNELTSTMKSGELVVTGNATPFVLRKMWQGKIENMTREFQTYISVISFERTRSTRFTKAGYVGLMIGNSQGQMLVYIKKVFLKEFFSAICMASV